MLLDAKTRIYQSYNRPILESDAASIQAGSALRAALSGGLGVVGLSDATTTQSFAGVAWTPYRPATTLTRIDTVGPISVATPTALLSRLATGSLTADVTVVNVATNAALTIIASGAPTNAQVTVETVAGRTRLTFHADHAGNTYAVTYRHAANPSDVAAWGELYGGAITPAEKYGTLSVILGGEVFTDQFDTGANWYASAAVPSVKMIAGGLFTLSTSSKPGTVLPDDAFTITQVPTADFPFLGILIR